MPVICCVPGCSQKRNGVVRFFSIPAVKTREGFAAQLLCERRRREWLKAIGRKELTNKTVRQFHVVCANHFVSGKPSYLHHDTEIDWVPTVNMRPDYHVAARAKRCATFKAIQLKKKKHEAASTLLDLSRINMDLEEKIVNLEQIQNAYEFGRESRQVVRTPVIRHVQDMFSGSESENSRSRNDVTNLDLYLKMENMQNTGSFKIRGVANQLRKLKKNEGSARKFVTMSAGNYGKAFAHCIRKMEGVKSVCVMPETSPINRVKLIESLGTSVVQTKVGDLQSEVDRFVQEEGYTFCHPFDDADLIAGYGGAGLELLEDVPDPDIVLVCCGGGGLVSGVSTALSLSGLDNCRVYAVEPEGAPTMHMSFEERRPMSKSDASSVAKGLAPPYTGNLCYRHCRWFVEDVLLVRDEEILDTTKLLFDLGIKAEPSGAAALAALLHGKVPDCEGKKVVVYITGGNISPSELAQLFPDDR